MKYFAQVGEQEYVIEIGQDGEPILIDGEPYAIDFRRMPGSGFVSLLLNHRSLEGVVEQRDGRWEVLIRGNLYDVTVADERTYRLARARGELTAVSGAAAIKSPMPGIIIAVPVQVGDVVRKGDKVAILESMKMENELRAPTDGTVVEVLVEAGASVEKDQLLVMLGDEPPMPTAD